MSRMKKRQLTKLVALYFAGSIALGGVAYAADGEYEVFKNGETYTIETPITEKDDAGEFTIFGGSDEKNVSASNITLQSGGAEGLYVLGGGYNGNVGTAAITVNGGLFEEVMGGGTAEDGGTAHVGTVTITVTGNDVNTSAGSMISGGGMAEIGGTSTVDKATIDFKGGTVDYIFGGGSGVDGGLATVGNTTVNVSDGNVLNAVFGGGLANSEEGEGGKTQVTGTATVNISGGTIGGQPEKMGDGIYGGGYASAAVREGKTSQDIVRTANVHITGGTINSDVYGGGYAAVEIDENTGLIGKGKAESSVDRVTVAISGKPTFHADSAVFAGGAAAGANASASVGEATLSVENSKVDSIYAGGRVVDGGTSAVESSTVTLGEGANVGIVSGGGEAVEGTDTVKKATIQINKGAHADAVFGGGTADYSSKVGKSTVESVSIEISGGEIKGQDNRSGVYGGGFTGFQGNETSVGNASILIQSGTINNNVYGGGYATDQATATVDTAKITVTGGEFAKDKRIYGGGVASNGGKSSVANSSIQLNNITLEGNDSGKIYVGGVANGADAVASVKNGVLSISNSKIINASIRGGGQTIGNNGGTSIVENSVVQLDRSAVSSVYGGGVANTGKTLVNEMTMTVTGSELGTVRVGGWATNGAISEMKKGTLQIDKDSTVQTVYGGGRTRNDMGFQTGGKVHVDESVITLDGAVEKAVFLGGLGEGNGSSTVGNSTLTVTGNATAAALYGGGKTIYDSGSPEIGGGTSKVTNATIVLEGGTVTGDIYGGGQSLETGTTEVTNATIKLAGGTVKGDIKRAAKAAALR